jgi:hypothetical protein
MDAPSLLKATVHPIKLPPAQPRTYPMIIRVLPTRAMPLAVLCDTYPAYSLASLHVDYFDLECSIALLKDAAFPKEF